MFAVKRAVVIETKNRVVNDRIFPSIMCTISPKDYSQNANKLLCREKEHLDTLNILISIAGLPFSSFTCYEET